MQNQQETLKKRTVGPKEISSGIMGAVIHYTKAVQIEDRCSVNDAKRKAIVLLKSIAKFMEDEINESENQELSRQGKDSTDKSEGSEHGT